MKTWGWELVCDLGGCDFWSITNADNIRNFSKYLVEAIDMKAYGEAIIVHFGEGDKEGYTLIQLISTSNISGHFSNDTCSAFINIFSCKPFEKQVVLDTLKQFFNPRFINTTLLDRIAYF